MAVVYFDIEKGKMVFLKGVLSPILFTIMVNDIFDNLGYSVGCVLYVDDGAVWKRGRNTKQVISGMQTVIKKGSFEQCWNDTCERSFSHLKI